MNYFKDKNTGEVYAYNQEQIDGGWVKEGLIAMTDEEVSAHLAPKPPTAEQVRAERDALLREVDALATNPLRWWELSDKQKTEVAEYRQLLLDVPAQAGFPENVEWPAEP